MKSSQDARLPDRTLSVGALAERFGLATHVLRHWETVGLLHPDRDRNGRRRYSHRHLVQVAVILRAKEGGLSLEAIRDMTNAPNGATRRTMLMEQRDAPARRIAGLRRSLDLIQCALDCEHEDITACPNFQQAAGIPPEFP